jgi:hypothetical protein
MTPPPGSEFARPLPEVDPTLPAPETGVETEAAPEVAAADPAQQPAPDTNSAARPDPSPQPPRAPAVPDAVPDAVNVPATLPAPEVSAIVDSEPKAPAAPATEPAPAGAELPPPPPLTAEEEALLLPKPPAPAADPTPPTPGFPDPVDGVTTGRLPSIATTPPAGAAAGPLLAQDDSRPPLQRYARPFENPAAKPVFALLLIDTGGPEVDRTSLANLPFPVSFVIDPLAPDAATAAAIYRAAGQEVVMLGSGIPAGATASDLEVTFQTHASALPEAVAVIDLEAGGFQGDRGLSAEVATIIKGQGRGLLTYERGLNAADQVARREGLPTATVFRRLDGENEASPAIRRYLDRAAFKAAQDGRVVVIGTTRPETVAALLEWSVEGRASSVALAPATAVLSVQ